MSPCAPSRFHLLPLGRRRWRSIVCLALLSFGLIGPGVADEFSSDRALVEPPLFSCAVGTTGNPSRSMEGDANAFLARFRTAEEDPLASYQRGLGGRWTIPVNVDRTDPWVRCLLLAPEMPLVIDTAVFFDGKPYTAARESLIDELVEHATVETLVREVVDIPVDDDIPELSLTKPKAPPSEEEAVVPDSPPEESAETASAESAAEEETDDQEEATPEDTEAEKTESEETEAEEDVPMVEIRQREARTVAQRLLNYMTSADVEADREEIRWLIAEWTGGPALLNLGAAFSWQRVGIAPVWNVLDQDNDDTLSLDEVKFAPQRLKQADTNENGVLDLQELFRAGGSRNAATRSYPLLVVLSRDTDWSQLRRDLRMAYGRRGATQQGCASSFASALQNRIVEDVQSIRSRELKELLDADADMVLAVHLGGEDARVDIHPVDGLTESTAVLSATENLISVVRGSVFLEFTAAQTKKPDPSVPRGTQLALGAVEDGYPLFRMLDRNGDRRLSSREQRALSDQLTELDLDHDGQLSGREKPSGIRLAFTRGPHVHQFLAQPMNAAYLQENSRADDSDTIAAPAWFTDMDRNRDGDVSRSEFLGNSAQFSQMDQDGMAF